MSDETMRQRQGFSASSNRECVALPVRPAPRGRARRCASLSTLFTIAFSLCSSSANAQSPPRVWTPQSAASRAATRAPGVQSARAALIAASAQRSFSERSRFGNPIFAVRAMVGLPDTPAATIGLLAGLPIDVSGRLGAYAREAAWGIREAERAVDVAENEARARAKESCVDVALSEQLLAATQSRYDNAREFFGRTRARADAEAATALDLALSERDVALAEADLAGARRERTDAVNRLREALDLDAAAPVHVAPIAAPSMPGAFTRESAVRYALSRRRETHVLHASAARFRAMAERSRASAVDPVTVNAEFEMQGYMQSTFGASVQWSLPVIQRAQGESNVALAEAASAEIRRDIARRQIAREVGAAWDALEQRLGELDALTQRALPATERTLQQTERLFERGAADYFRVLVARRELGEVRLRQLAALRDAWRARASLDRAMTATEGAR